MRVEHRSGSTRPDDFQMEQDLAGRAPGADRRAALVDLDDFVRAEMTLERRARRDGDLQRIERNDGAEVAAGAEYPAAGVEPLAHINEVLRDLRKALRRHLENNHYRLLWSISQRERSATSPRSRSRRARPARASGRCR